MRCYSVRVPPSPVSLSASAALLGGLGLLAACAVEPRSCELESNAIVLHATVTDGDRGVEVELELEAAAEGDEPGTPLTLCVESGEQLRVNGRSAKQVRALGQVFYTVEFDAPETTYTVEYVRDDETIELALEMPPTFEISTPTEDQIIPRSEPIMVSWSPTWPDHMIQIAVEDRVGSDCLEGLGYSTEAQDLGTATIGANSIEAGAAKAAETCKAWIAITRSSVGTYPSQLHEGGSFEGYVKRRRRFQSSG